MKKKTDKEFNAQNKDSYISQYSLPLTLAAIGAGALYIYKNKHLDNVPGLNYFKTWFDNIQAQYNPWAKNIEMPKLEDVNNWEMVVYGSNIKQQSVGVLNSIYNGAMQLSVKSGADLKDLSLKIAQGTFGSILLYENNIDPTIEMPVLSEVTTIAPEIVMDATFYETVADVASETIFDSSNWALIPYGSNIDQTLADLIKNVIDALGEVA